MKIIAHENLVQPSGHVIGDGEEENYDRKRVGKLKLKIGYGEKLNTKDISDISFLNITEKLEILEFALSCRDFSAVEKIISVKEQSAEKQRLSDLSKIFPEITEEEWIIRCLGRYLKKDFSLTNAEDKKTEINIAIDNQIKIINHYLENNGKTLDIKIYNIFNSFIDEDMPETNQTTKLVEVFLDNGLSEEIKQIPAGALIFNLMISEKYLIMKEIFARLDEMDIKKIIDCGSINNFPGLNAINKTRELLKDRINYIQSNKEAEIISEVLPVVDEDQITGKKI